MGHSDSRALFLRNEAPPSSPDHPPVEQPLAVRLQERGVVLAPAAARVAPIVQVVHRQVQHLLAVGRVVEPAGNIQAAGLVLSSSVPGPVEC